MQPLTRPGTLTATPRVVPRMALGYQAAGPLNSEA